MTDETAKEPRLVFDAKAAFIQRKLAGLEIQQKEARLLREGQRLNRQAERLKRQGDAAEAAGNQDQADELMDAADELFGQADEMMTAAQALLHDKVNLLAEFITAIEMPDGTRRAQPKEPGAERDAFVVEVKRLLMEADEAKFNEMLSALTGVKSSVTPPNGGNSATGSETTN